MIDPTYVPVDRTGCGRPAQQQGSFCGIPTRQRGITYICAECEPLLCLCRDPAFNGVGECTRCRRLDLRSLRT